MIIDKLMDLGLLLIKMDLPAPNKIKPFRIGEHTVVNVFNYSKYNRFNVLDFDYMVREIKPSIYRILGTKFYYRNFKWYFWTCLNQCNYMISEKYYLNNMMLVNRKKVDKWIGRFFDLDLVNSWIDNFPLINFV